MIGTSPGFLNLPQPSWSEVTCDSEIAEVFFESGRAIGHFMWFIWKQTLCHSHSCHDFLFAQSVPALTANHRPFLDGYCKCPLNLNFVGPSLGTPKFLGSAVVVHERWKSIKVSVEQVRCAEIRCCDPGSLFELSVHWMYGGDINLNPLGVQHVNPRPWRPSCEPLGFLISAKVCA